MYDPLNSCVILSPVRDPCSCFALSILPKRQPYLASLSGQRRSRSVALPGHFDAATCHGWQCKVFRVARWVLFTRMEACGGNVSRTIVAKESSTGDDETIQHSSLGVVRILQPYITAISHCNTSWLWDFHWSQILASATPLPLSLLNLYILVSCFNVSFCPP